MISLYGALGKKFKEQYDYEPLNIKIKIKSAGEALRALYANFPGFKQLIDRKLKYRVIRGEDIDSGKIVKVEEMNMSFNNNHFHFIPKASGGMIDDMEGFMMNVFSNKPEFNDIFSFAHGIVKFGINNTPSFHHRIPTPFICTGSGGPSQDNAPTPVSPPASTRETANERPSYLFSGAVNTTEPGLTIPVAYGETWIGSIFVSGGIKIEDV